MIHRLGFYVLTATLLLIAGGSPARVKELLIPAGSLSETTAPMWVAVEKGFFKKYGFDVKMLQVRSGGLSMAALASGSVQIVQSSPASIIGFASAGGVKVVCFASTIDKIPRNLMVRKEIQTLADLREKTSASRASAAVSGCRRCWSWTPLASIRIDTGCACGS